MLRMHLAVTIAFLLVLPASGAAMRIPTEASAKHDTICKDEWTKRGVLDQHMFDFCMDQQAEGFKNIQDLVSKYDTQPWLQQALDSAIRKWSKRDTRNDSMVAFELKNQIEAYLDSVYISKQPNYNSTAFEQCKYQWMRRSPDWSMAMYCYKEKTGG